MKFHTFFCMRPSLNECSIFLIFDLQVKNKLPFILLVDRVLQQTELEFKMVTTSFPIEY